VISCPREGQLKVTTAVSASATPPSANHSRLKAARVMAFSKLLAKPWMNTRMLRPPWARSLNAVWLKPPFWRSWMDLIAPVLSAVSPALST
jgi:hypothetical protein